MTDTHSYPEGESARLALAYARDRAYERLHVLCGTRADSPGWDDIATLLRERDELYAKLHSDSQSESGEIRQLRIDNARLRDQAFLRSHAVAQAPGDDPQITISVLQMLSPTEQADIDFLLNSLVDPNVDPTFNRGVVAGFRRQLINVAAAEATLLALSSAPAQQAVECGVDRIADIISDYYDEDDSGRWRKCAEHIASVVSSTNHQSLDHLLDGMTDENRHEELPVSPICTDGK